MSSHYFPPALNARANAYAPPLQMPSPRHGEVSRLAYPQPFTAVDLSPSYPPAGLPDTFVGDEGRLLGSSAPTSAPAPNTRVAAPERSRVAEIFARWREGSLEDWDYWNHHGEQYKRTAVGVMFVSLLTAIGYGTYRVVEDILRKKREEALAASL